MRRVDYDFDLIVYVIVAPISAPEMKVFSFKLIQRNLRQIRYDAAMNVLRIYPSKSLTIFIQQIQGETYLHAKEGVRAAISSWRFYRSKVFALFEVQCAERKYVQSDDPRTVFRPIISISNPLAKATHFT